MSKAEHLCEDLKRRTKRMGGARSAVQAVGDGVEFIKRGGHAVRRRTDDLDAAVERRVDALEAAQERVVDVDAQPSNCRHTASDSTCMQRAGKTSSIFSAAAISSSRASVCAVTGM